DRKELNANLFNELVAWETPEYIRRNMIHTCRYYQEEAVRALHHSHAAKEFRYRNVNHVLFNMATGSEQQAQLALLGMYLYQEQGYENLLFLVKTNGVLSKTVDNLTNVASDKYLYTPQIEIEGERIEIRQVQAFPKIQSENTIYIKLATVQRIAADIY